MCLSSVQLMETMVDIGLRRGFCETSYLVGLVFVLIKTRSVRTILE